MDPQGGALRKVEHRIERGDVILTPRPDEFAYRIEFW